MTNILGKSKKSQMNFRKYEII